MDIEENTELPALEGSLESPTHEEKIELPALLTQKDLCGYLDKSEAWAERARLEGTGPPFIKIGRSVRYTWKSVLGWLQERERTSTGSNQ